MRLRLVSSVSVFGDFSGGVVRSHLNIEATIVLCLSLHTNLLLLRLLLHLLLHHRLLLPSEALVLVLGDALTERSHWSHWRLLQLEALTFA